MADDQGNPFLLDPFNTTSAAGGIVLRWDLDIVGRLSQRREADALLRKTRLEREAAWMQISLQVRTARQRFADSLEKVRIAKRAHRAARGWLTAKADLFDAGFVKFDDLSDAVNAFYERRLKELAARHAALQAELNLAEALGMRPEELARFAGGTTE